MCNKFIEMNRLYTTYCMLCKDGSFQYICYIYTTGWKQSNSRKTSAPASNQILVTLLSSLYPTHYFDSAIPVPYYSQNKHHSQVNGLRQCSQYCNSQQAGWSLDQNLVGARFSVPVQTGPEPREAGT